MKFNVGSLLIGDDENDIKEEDVATKASAIEKEHNTLLPEIKRLAIKEEHEL